MGSSITIDMIKQSIACASQILPTVWPLKASIAINPLWDLTEDSFAGALSQISEYLPVKGYLSHQEYLSLYNQGHISEPALNQAFGEEKRSYNKDKLFEIITLDELDCFSHEKYYSVLKAISAKIQFFFSQYFDEQQEKLTNSSLNNTLWQEWREYSALRDPKNKHVYHNLSSDPFEAILSFLGNTNLNQNQITRVFKKLYSKSIGWHGLIKWLESRSQPNQLVRVQATLAEVVAIWCASLQLEKFDLESFALNIQANASRRNLSDQEVLSIWQRAYEITYKNTLIPSLKWTTGEDIAPNAQFVFCIDVRSEALRRHLESVNRYQTFGFAGFFGSIFSVQNESKSQCQLQSPALVEPNIVVRKSTTLSFTSKIICTIQSIVSRVKNNNLGAFAFFEMFGSWMIISLFQKTFLAKLDERIKHPFSTHTNPFLEPDKILDTSKNMGSFLRSIGLVKNFSSRVIICGHQAITNNNPFHATFECGACGGNSGYINAAITCEILNHPEIRLCLSKEGIEIPETTRFVSAYHETTTDKLILNTEAPDPMLQELEKDIQIALNNLSKERLKKLPQGRRYQDRAYHYAELIPEWGLANNAAMIIGPRFLSQNSNLDSRVFLHSYDPDIDPDGNILEGILTAPVIVAHWINAQYYFSATDPDIYGAGNKALHNVVSKIGVIEGNQGDLKIGLPQQSIFFQNTRVHVPLRLLVVIYAYPHQLEAIFSRQPKINHLFDSDWLGLHILTPRARAYV